MSVLQADTVPRATAMDPWKAFKPQTDMETEVKEFALRMLGLRASTAKIEGYFSRCGVVFKNKLRNRMGNARCAVVLFGLGNRV